MIPQVGVDDRVSPTFKQVKLHAAVALVQEGSQSSCRNYARYGVPQAMRAAVWERALGEEDRHQPLGVNKHAQRLQQLWGGALVWFH